MADAPAISVVIPTRDRWRMLSTRALPASLEQIGVEFEVVVVDDGSVDGTADLLAEVDDPRLRVVRRRRSGGMAAARNAGLEAAHAEWVAFLDDDDVWSPRKLRAQLDAVSATDADFCYTAAIAVDTRGTVLDVLYLPPAEELEAKLAQACVVPAGCSNVMARTSLVRSLGGFDESLVHVADWDLWIGLAARGRAAVCEDVLVAYLLHEGNIHVVDDPSPELEILARKHAHGDPPRLITPDLLGYSRWVAGQRSRAGRHGDAARIYARSAVRHRSLGNLARAGDALLGKRVSRLMRRAHASRPAPAALPVAPDWLGRFAE